VPYEQIWHTVSVWRRQPDGGWLATRLLRIQAAR
jgi:hypothetical protein